MINEGRKTAEAATVVEVVNVKFDTVSITNVWINEEMNTVHDDLQSARELYRTTNLCLVFVFLKDQFPY